MKWGEFGGLLSMALCFGFVCGVQEITMKGLFAILVLTGVSGLIVVNMIYNKDKE